jgi:hypothetical protein
MKRALILTILILALAVLAGCAAGPNEMAHTPGGGGKVAGFWQGLWHGIIAPVTFVWSLFNRTVRMYEVHNNGGWYDFGFLLGMMLTLGGGGGGAAASRSRG